MDIILIILGAIGLSAILLAVYIVAVVAPPRAPNTAVSEYVGGVVGKPRLYRERSAADRRSARVVSFPLMVDGDWIVEDRRILADRRMDAA